MTGRFFVISKIKHSFSLPVVACHVCIHFLSAAERVKSITMLVLTYGIETVFIEYR